MNEVGAHDRRLVDHARRGDEDAFARIYGAHQGAIYRYALHMCGAGAADDVVQETFLALLRQPDRFDPARGTLVAYLFGIARHVLLKRLSIARAESAFDDEEELSAAVDTASAFDALSRAETIDRVRAAIQTLPPPYREVVVLCELQELDYAEAAAIIACPVGTVRSRLHRARALLTSKLTSERPAEASRCSAGRATRR